MDNQAKQFCVGQELFVDHDPEVIAIWQVKYNATFKMLPLPMGTTWSHCKNVGLCGKVCDSTIVEACRTQANFLVSMSPPCQSWSKGGLTAGLNDCNGKAFLEALELSFHLQAVAIAAECADDIVSHPHFNVIKAFARVLGYRLVWDQVTPFQTMASHARTRWLGVWSRADLVKLSLSSSSCRRFRVLIGQTRHFSSHSRASGFRN